MQTSELYLAGTIQFSWLITPVNVITSFSTVPYWSLTTEISAKWQNIMLTQFCLFVCSWFQWLTWHSFAANNSYYIALHCRYINWLLGKNFKIKLKNYPDFSSASIIRSTSDTGETTRLNFLWKFFCMLLSTRYFT